MFLFTRYFTKFETLLKLCLQLPTYLSYKSLLIVIDEIRSFLYFLYRAFSLLSLQQRFVTDCKSFEHFTRLLRVRETREKLMLRSLQFRVKKILAHS